MKRAVFLVLVPLVLSACASKVDLDKKAPVENAASSSINGAAGANGVDASAAQQGALEAQRLAKLKLNSAIAEAQKKVVYFGFDEYNVKPEYNAVIADNAAILKDNPTVTVDLQGNTDSRGSREYNLALGQRRADAVQQALQLQGVNASQIQAISFGKEKPAVQGSTPEDMALNRRVNFFYHN